MWHCHTNIYGVVEITNHLVRSYLKRGTERVAYLRKVHIIPNNLRTIRYIFIVHLSIKWPSI